MAIGPVGHARGPKWSLTQHAFDGLLALLDSDRDTAAKRYIEIRRNLVRLFEWRGCSTPEEHADETINRCARKIDEGEPIRDLATYSIGVARMLWREKSRERCGEPRPLHEAPEPQATPAEPHGDLDRRVECLQRCLDRLTPGNRDVILQYYEGGRGDKIATRKGLAQRFGVPAGALRMRALRLRETLRSCTEDCVQLGEK
jgi:DNA-directed RNA polymerase specialized sigma24 family protein